MEVVVARSNGGLIASAPWLFNGHSFQRLRPSFRALALRVRARVRARRSARRGCGGSVSGKQQVRSSPSRSPVRLYPYQRRRSPVRLLVRGGFDFVRSDGSCRNWPVLFCFLSPIIFRLSKEMRAESLTACLARIAFFWGGGDFPLGRNFDSVLFFFPHGEAVFF